MASKTINQVLIAFNRDIAPKSSGIKPLLAHPQHAPDLGAIRKKVMASFSKTLAYLAK